MALTRLAPKRLTRFRGQDGTFAIGSHCGVAGSHSRESVNLARWYPARLLLFHLIRRRQLPNITTCEARHRIQRGEWEVVSADQAAALGQSFDKRCVECHGRVLPRAHGGAIRMEHAQECAGCSLGNCYDGQGQRLHPAVVI
jgi:hypothetical protein